MPCALFSWKVPSEISGSLDIKRAKKQLSWLEESEYTGELVVQVSIYPRVCFREGGEDRSILLSS